MGRRPRRGVDHRGAGRRTRRGVGRRSPLHDAGRRSLPGAGQGRFDAGPQSHCLDEGRQTRPQVVGRPGAGRRIHRRGAGRPGAGRSAQRGAESTEPWAAILAPGRHAPGSRRCDRTAGRRNRWGACHPGAGRRSHRHDAGRSGAGIAGCGVKIAMAAPWGSDRTAKRSISGISVAGFQSLPPASTIFST